MYLVLNALTAEFLETQTYYSLFSNFPQYTLFAPQILHKLLFLNAPGSTAFSQGHFKTISYAKFGGQTECIMGNWKIVNTDSTFKPKLFSAFFALN